MRARQIGFFKFSLPLWLLILLACEPCAGVAQAQPQGDLGEKNVLILHAAEANAPIFQETDRGLAKALQTGGISNLNQFFQSLDLRRNPDSEYRTLLAREMGLRYRHRAFGLIITMFPEALLFVLNEGRALFPDVPILALYLPRNIELPQTDRRIVRHVAVPDARRTLEIALKLVPDARRVYVVSGAHEFDREREERARRVFTQWDGRLEFHYLSRLPAEEMLKTLAGAPRDSIVLFLTYSKDIAGKSFLAPDLVERMREVSAAPIFALSDVTLGHGSVGGALISYQRVGADAGRLALELLRGSPALEGTERVLDVPTVPMFDWRELKRWNLNVAALPPGSVIINREYTLWEQYRSWVVGAAVLVGLQTLLIVGLLWNRTRRRRAEDTLAQRLRFETLLSDLSAQFVHLPADQVDREIENAQRRVCECLSLDVSNLWQPSGENPHSFTMTHLYGTLEGPPLPERVDAAEYFPWVLQHVMAGKTLAVASMGELPAEAARDQEVWRQVGVKAALIIPLSTGGRTLIGAVAFGTMRAERTWPDALVTRLQLVAQILANALARKRSEAMLRGSEERLSLATDSAGAGLWSMELKTQRVWASPRMHELFSFAAGEELTFESFLTVIHPEDREAVHQSVQRAIETDAPLLVEYRIVLPDGSLRWINARGHRHCNPSGEPDRLMGASIDITERKRAEAEARRHVQELAHLSRVSTVGELTTSLAHELNQPLGAILRNAEAAELLLRADVPDLEELRAIVADIRTDDERAGNVIDRLRALLKRRNLDLQPVSLARLVDEVVSVVRSDAMGRGIQLATDVPANLPPVRGDWVHLQQVLLNLIVNAMDALNRAQHGDRRVVIRARLAGDRLIEVAVSDSGPGIPPETMSRLFEPFFTTKAGGMGMGLPISRTIIEAHDGRIWAENNDRCGGTLRFTLPVAGGKGDKDEGRGTRGEGEKTRDEGRGTRVEGEEEEGRGAGGGGRGAKDGGNE